MIDGTSNPYLFTAAVLQAGISGLGDADGGGNLRWTDCHMFLSSLDEGERTKYHLNDRMPSSLQEALEALKADAALKMWMSEDLLKTYISVKDKEVETFQKMSDVQRRLRFLEYF